MAGLRSPGVRDGSVRGQNGAAITVVVLATILVLDHTLLRGSLASMGLGLGRPSARGVVTAVLIGGVLMAFFHFVRARRTFASSSSQGTLPLLPGLFLQGGFGEELLFRGFLLERTVRAANPLRLRARRWAQPRPSRRAATSR